MHLLKGFDGKMCGRFVLISDLSVIARDFGISGLCVHFSSNRNVCPGLHIPAVVHREHKNVLAAFLWGLIPCWAKDPSIGAKLINARAETLAQKPSFRSAFAQRRCLIPADGFFEWKKEGNQKIPFCFGLKSGAPFYFAGLYEAWIAPDKKQVDSCTIITTAANSLVSPVHNRMPVIVPADRQQIWLSAGGEDVLRLTDILKPYPAQEMECKPADFTSSTNWADGSRCFLPKD